MNQTICLNMIVKNEAPIIRDTLENILSYIPITSYMISDTGSTDNTVDVILQFFQERGIPGQIRLDHWQNFAYNRNLALMEATGKSDYVFFFDADDRFVGNLQLPEVLTADSYNFQFSNQAQTTTYQRPLLVRNNGTFRWRSVVHEYIDSDEPILSDFISGDYNVISGRFGARSQNPNKYFEDAEMLTEAYYNHPEEDEELLPRYAFYAANSYRDADMPELAIEWYKRRIEHGGWIEEIAKSYESMGECYQSLGNKELAINAWLLGYDAHPNRIETLHLAIKQLRKDDKYRLAFQLALIAKDVPCPLNGLFVDKTVYEYGIDFELSICAYYNQHFQLGYESCRNVLFAHPDYETILTTINNLQFYKEFGADDSIENRQQLIAILARYSKEEAPFSYEMIQYLLETLNY